MGNFGLNGDVPWLTNTDGKLCAFCKDSVEDVNDNCYDMEHHKSLFIAQVYSAWAHNCMNTWDCIIL